MSHVRVAFAQAPLLKQPSRLLDLLRILCCVTRSVSFIVCSRGGLRAAGVHRLWLQMKTKCASALTTIESMNEQLLPLLTTVIL